MARYTGPAVKLCRREGVNLFDSDKVAKYLAKRENPPGQHGARRKGRPSDFSVRLREKQKLIRIYGMSEKPFRNLFSEAARKVGVTGTIFLQLLESRLDNVVYRMGIASTRRQARQFVGHDHIRVNGKRVTIASYRVKPGDVISVKESSKSLLFIKENVEAQKRRRTVNWISFDPEKLEGKFERLPAREDLVIPVNEQFVVEYYSR
ncbi:MAG: 30S ribosomal protein S4 [Deinococcales bacterium]